VTVEIPVYAEPATAAKFVPVTVIVVPPAGEPVVGETVDTVEMTVLYTLAFVVETFPSVLICICHTPEEAR
jgi:hypothetical protein